MVQLELPMFQMRRDLGYIECLRGGKGMWTMRLVAVVTNMGMPRDVPGFAVIAGTVAKMVKSITSQRGHNWTAGMVLDGGYETRGPVYLFLS